MSHFVCSIVSNQNARRMSDLSRKHKYLFATILKISELDSLSDNERKRLLNSSIGFHESFLKWLEIAVDKGLNTPYGKAFDVLYYLKHADILDISEEEIRQFSSKYQDAVSKMP